ncbi:Formin-like protein [Rhynchospora pubera]|uniref:Formin-like protein n=1 Tax=Rhynchospora pubera TaxID=906938 RepID=A0AAV8F548_9POAL|nr:Formin-like protein [Rhynchospora pubera]
MALFRRLFYRKPPDRLLEITDRVYVFDCCFSTKTMEEEEFRTYIDGIISQLQDHFPGASFMVFNFGQGSGKDLLSPLLSPYNITMKDYPQQFSGCPLLSLETISNFLIMSEAWLTNDSSSQNIMLMHCESGGWPLLAFMLASLLLYRKQYTGEQRTLEMVYKQGPKELLGLLTPLNPTSSHLRYLQYVGKLTSGLERQPQIENPFTLDCLILRVVPSFDRKDGCRPIIRVHGQDSSGFVDKSSQILFSTPKTKKHVKHYRKVANAPIKLNVGCRVEGDVVLECIHLGKSLEDEKVMFRVMFNTRFIQSQILMLTLDDIDVAWESKDHFSRDFKAEVLFSEFHAESDASGSDADMDFGEEFFEAEEMLEFPDLHDEHLRDPNSAFFDPSSKNTVEFATPRAEAGSYFPFGKPTKKQALDETMSDDSGMITGTPTEEISLLHEVEQELEMQQSTVTVHVAPIEINVPLAAFRKLMTPQTLSLPPPIILRPILQESTSVTSLVEHGENDFAHNIKYTTLQSQATQVSQLPPPSSLPAPSPPPTACIQTVPLQPSSSHVETSSNIDLSQRLPILNPPPPVPQPPPPPPSLKPSQLSPHIVKIESGAPVLCIENVESSMPQIPPPPPLPLRPRANGVKPPLTPPSPPSPRGHGRVLSPGPPSLPLHPPTQKTDVVIPPPPPPPPFIRECGRNLSPVTPLHSPPLPPPPPPPRISTASSTSTSSPSQSSPQASSGPPPPPPPTPPPKISSASSASSPFQPSPQTCSRPSAPPPPPPPRTSNTPSISSPFESPHGAYSELLPPPPPPPYRSSSGAPSEPPTCIVPPPAPPPPAVHIRAQSTLSPTPLECNGPPLPPPPPPPPQPFGGGGGSLPSSMTHVGANSVPPPPPPPPGRHNSAPPPPPPQTAPASGAPPPPPLPRRQEEAPPFPPSPPGGHNEAPSPPPPRAQASGAPPPPPPPIAPASGAPPPPPLPRIQGEAPPPPPPPPGGHIGAPPPPPPPPPSASGNMAPPPPPPPTARASGAPPPPPPPGAPASGAPPPPPPPGAPASGAPPPPPMPRGHGGAPPPPAPPGGAPGPPRAPGAPPPPPSKGGNPQASLKGFPGNLVGGRGPGLGRSASAVRKSSLKPLHWIKVTRVMNGTLWAELQRQASEPQIQEDFDVNELEQLFSAIISKPNDGSKEKQKSAASKSDKVHLIDLRRANNTEIMLTKIKMPLSDMMNAVLAMDDSILDGDQVENLLKFCPTKEEMESLKTYPGDKENLGKCEQYFLELMKVPRVESKLRVFSFKIQFTSQMKDVTKSLQLVGAACDAIRNSEKLKEIMKKILNLGNTMNQGTARGSAVGFKLDSLLKLADTRGKDSKVTLMHYLCKVTATKWPHLMDFHEELAGLENASKIQLKVLTEEQESISKGLKRAEGELKASKEDGPVSEIFRKTLEEFVTKSQADVEEMKARYTAVEQSAKDLSVYFGEDPAKCPFEQVMATILNFVRLFRKAHDENLKYAEMEKKKAQKDAEEKSKEEKPTAK